jgi:phytoene desaturase (3,4-didehydrolycopene-forming)
MMATCGIRISFNRTTNSSQRFDQGPSLLLLPNLFVEAFSDLGATLESEGVNILKCHDNYNIWFHDGERFKLSTDQAQMKREIERWEGKDGFTRYLDFLKEAHTHYELSITHVLNKNYPSLFSMLRPSFIRQTLNLHPFDSLYSRASRYFWTERLRRVFTFGSMYMGMSPYDAPGTYSLLQYTELAEGIWYPEGGFNRVLAALAVLGEKFGVEYRLSSTVKDIKLSPPTSSDNRRAQGVILESGEALHADVVVINADLVYAYNNLLPPSSRAVSYSKRPSSCSSISFYWAMDRVVPELTGHNIFLAEEYRSSFDDIFKRQQIPADPSFYVNVPTRVDPSAAPAGKDTIVVLVPVGHLLDVPAHKGIPAQDWPAMVDKARKIVLSTIKSRTGVDIRPYIAHEIVNEPNTWKEKFNLDKGAILGLSHSFFNVLSFRPNTKHPSIGQLYFVGASTHPGTGVPICLAGSKITSEQILEDYGMAKPWGMKYETKVVREIDRVKPPDTMIALPILIMLVITMTLTAYFRL